jgi:hypothetical protein
MRLLPMQVVLMNQVITQRGDDGAFRIVPALGEHDLTV